MADGQDPFSQAEQPIAPVARDMTERGLGMVRDTNSPLYRALEQYHGQRVAQAQMYQKNASEALGILHYGKNPQTGQDLTPEEQQKWQSQADYATEQYGKLIGVTKENKSALEKAKSIIDYVRGQRQAQLGAPPSPQDMAREQAYQQRMNTVRTALQAPFNQQGAMTNLAIDTEGRKLQAGIDQRMVALKKVYGEDLDMSDPIVQDYALTGRVAGSMLSNPYQQASKYIESTDGIVHPAIFDRRTGKYRDAETHEEIIGGKVISPSDLATRTLNVMFPEGPRVITRKGDKFYDTHGNQLEGEIVPLQRGMIPTYSEHEMPGNLADGTPVKFVMKRITTPQMGNIPSPYGGNAPAPAAPAPPAPGAAPTRGGNLTPAPQAAGATPKAAATKKKGGGGLGGPMTLNGQMVFTTPQFKDLSTKATGVDQARNSLVGDKIDSGEVGGLAKDLEVFKNPDSMKRIGEYLQLIHNQSAQEGDSFAKSGDSTGAVKWFLGLPQLAIGLQQGALRDQYATLNESERRFVADYFRVMGTMGGMRASTGMPAYEWAFTNMYNEMPTPGKVNNYDDAIWRLSNYVNETNVVSKRNKLVGHVDTDDLEKKIRGGGPSNRKPATPPPSAPSAAPKTSDEFLNKYNLKPQPKNP